MKNTDSDQASAADIAPYIYARRCPLFLHVLDYAHMQPEVHHPDINVSTLNITLPAAS